MKPYSKTRDLKITPYPADRAAAIAEMRRRCVSLDLVHQALRDARSRVRSLIVRELAGERPHMLR